MATERTPVVVGPGGDYADIPAALSGISATITDLVAADEIAVIELESGAGALGQPEINANNYGFNTDATRYIVVRPQAGAEHTGQEDANVWLHPTSSGDPMVRANSEHLIFDGVQVQTWDPGSFVHREICQWDSSSDAVYWTRCVVVVGDDPVTPFAGGSGDDGPYFYNGVIIGEGTADGSVAFAGHTGGAPGKSGRVYNTTIYNVSVGIDPNQTTFDVRNVVCFGCSEAFDDPSSNGGYDAASTNNADDLAGAASSCTTRGIGTIDNVASSDFTDAAGGDLSLAAGSVLIDAGADLSAAPLPITADALGTARPQGGGYDIGAFEFEVTVVDVATGQPLSMIHEL